MKLHPLQFWIMVALLVVAIVGGLVKVVTEVLS